MERVQGGKVHAVLLRPRVRFVFVFGLVENTFITVIGGVSDLFLTNSSCRLQR